MADLHMTFAQLHRWGGSPQISPIAILVTPLILLTTTALLSLSTYILSNLYLHPLSKHPGPLLGRISPLYDLYHAYIGDKHLLLHHLHAKYGTIVRFTPNTLSINDPAALKAIYAHGANAQKAEFYTCFRAAPNAISTLLATEKAHSARKRRVMGQAFSEGAVRGLEAYVLTHVDELVTRVSCRASNDEDGNWSPALDMQAWSNYFVFDVMGDLVFGQSFGTLGTQPGNREAIRLLGRAARRNYTVAALPMLVYSGVEKWVPPLRGLWRDRGLYLGFGRKCVVEKMGRDKAQEKGGGDGSVVGRKDIFSILLHAKDPETGEGLSWPELWMEGNTLIVAGSDTSSTTLAATLFYLLANPVTLKRLEREIRSTFSRPEDIRMGPALQSCTYLRASIDEAMRLTPAVPGLLPREVLPGGLAIPSLDLNLPAGVNVGVCIYSIHRHADYVPDPFTYDPDRWFREGEEKEALHAVFNPFSVGARSCLGRPLVYMELSIAVARLVWGLEMRLAGDQRVPGFVGREVRDGKRDAREYVIQDWFLSNNFGPWVEVRRRDGAGGRERADSAVGG